jgi:hypothetical protein
MARPSKARHTTSTAPHPGSEPLETHDEGIAGPAPRDTHFRRGQLLRRPSAAELELANRILAFEGQSVARVYDKLHEQLAPLLGSESVRVMFARSVKLSPISGFGSLASAVAERGDNPGQRLEKSLQTHEPDRAAETAALALGIFVGLLISFIGERLTKQVLAGAWPQIGDAGTETVK